jgi:hypothetical protein
LPTARNLALRPSQRERLAGCRIDQSSPQFNKLREHWKKSGYPSIDDDLNEAFKAIAADVHAKNWRLVPRFSEVLGSFLLYKYRQKNNAAREGARGAWRFYALFDKTTSVLYPVVVYPKKAWADASDDVITGSLEEMIAILHPPKHS